MESESKKSAITKPLPEMDSESKKSRKGEEEDDLNRFSGLPDNILALILSYLDTETAVRTSVLSKNCRLIWTLSPSLDFKLRNYVSNVENVDSFQAFVNRVLQLRKHSNLEMFRLSVYSSVSLEFIQNCVDYAARHRVQRLWFRSYVENGTLTLPNLLVNSSFLVSLHLHNATVNCIVFPKSVALPNLKDLSLKNFEFSNRNFNSGVFSGCPDLETLVMSKCSIRAADTLRILNVDCLKLKKLEIKHWRSPWECFDEHKIDVNAPKLTDFKLIGHLVNVNFKEDLLCLENACIDLRYPTACSVVSVSGRKLRIARSFHGMLQRVCNVKVLSLSLETIEVLDYVSYSNRLSCIVFEKLRVLKFTAENKFREKTIDMKTVAMLVEDTVALGTDDMMFYAFEEKNDLPETSESRVMEIFIPLHVMRLFLDNCPAMEFLSIEIPNLSSDQE